jgi:hypothetical protein
MHKKYLEKLRSLIVKNNIEVFGIEYVSSNYDNQNRKIDHAIPIIMTDRSEIGIYNNNIYLTYIILSSTFDKRLYNVIKNLDGI